MEKFICIHGHFYQPPRENPWLEAVELQDSASPYHDWNERVTAECYAPNGHARLLDGDGRIERIVNNYSKISFNFGPTLLSWMKDKAADIHQAIVDADKESQRQFSGHGAALAQCYNHIIMPLANRRDKVTQVQWGIRDFESHFGRKPEGMWLPETAADDESLDALAEHGIKFTILSPFQISKIRPLNGEEWQDVNGAKADPTMPYLVKLASGRSIVVFIYDAEIAKAVAFEQLLNKGENLSGRLLGGFNRSHERNQLVNVATDGETYGHHSPSGDMALAYALKLIETEGQARLTIYGEYLEKHPPTHEAQIHQGSAWSCSHGVDRWRRNCGCNSGGHPGWNQNWREPLRNALDWLRDKLVECFEARAANFLKDPWLARNDYITLILDRSSENIRHFFQNHQAHDLNEADQISSLRLLEMQRHALLMFTSCGWFFDEISGLETVQVIQYAARAIQLASAFGADLELGFLEILGKAESNLPDPHDGRQVYEKFVKPAIMTREGVAAHYAISSLFQSYPEEARIYSFTVRQEDRKLLTAGKTRLIIGRIHLTFEITRGSDKLTYAVFHTGDHTINCAVREDGDLAAYENLVREMRAPFDRGNFPEMIRLMDRHFGPTHYSVDRLFHDEQRKVLDQILASPTEEIFNGLRLITDRYAPLMRFMADLRAQPLKALRTATEIVLNNELHRQFQNETMNLERVHSLLAECAATKVNLNLDGLAYALKGHLDRLSARFVMAHQDMDCLQHFVDAADLAQNGPFAVNLWKPQNIYYGMVGTALPAMRRCASQGDEQSRAWVEKFLVLGGKLGFGAAISSKSS